MKRLFDLALVAVTSPLWLTLLGVVLLLSLILQGRPLFFVQERVGKQEKRFNIIKVRTMINPQSSGDRKLSDDERVTRFGRILRLSSLDELPELINVIKGEMSLVGPRPLLPEYLPLYSSDQRTRHSVLPGLTGLAQISGRNQLSWDEKIAYDLQYVREKSLWLDLKILIRTLPEWLSGRAVGSAGGTVGTRFNGSNGK